MSTTRTDIHAPASPDFDPQAYQCVGVFDLRPEFGDGGNRMMTVNHQIDLGYRFAGSTAGDCGHCGARLRYAALMIHDNGRDMMYVGEQCLGNRFEADLTKDQFQELRATAKLNRERSNKQGRIQALVEQYPVLAVLLDPEVAARWGDFIGNLGWQLRDNGTLSERQIAAIPGSMARSVEWAHEAAVREDRERSAPPALPVPDSGKTRIVVEGEVLSTRWQDNDFGGGSVKMLLLADDGWKVWGTVPSSLDLGQGARVRFTATVKPSGDDPTFGFFSRPTKAELITG